MLRGSVALILRLPGQRNAQLEYGEWFCRRGARHYQEPCAAVYDVIQDN